MLLDLGRIDHSLVDLRLIKCLFDIHLDLLGQHRLDVLRNVLAVHTMAIAYGKEMSAAVLTQMRQDQEAVLVDFVWVLGRIAGLGRKCKLGHAVIKFLAGLSRLNTLVLLGCRNFLRNRSPYVVLRLFVLLLAFQITWGVSHFDRLMLAHWKKFTFLVMLIVVLVRSLNMSAVCVILFMDRLVWLLVIGG